MIKYEKSWPDDPCMSKITLKGVAEFFASVLLSGLVITIFLICWVSVQP